MAFQQNWNSTLAATPLRCQKCWTPRPHEGSTFFAPCPTRQTRTTTTHFPRVITYDTRERCTDGGKCSPSPMYTIPHRNTVLVGVTFPVLHRIGTHVATKTNGPTSPWRSTERLRKRSPSATADASLSSKPLRSLMWAVSARVNSRSISARLASSLTISEVYL